MKQPTFLLFLLIIADAWGQSMAGFENLGFEKGIEGWGVWYSDGDTYKGARYPYSADTEHVHSGKRSLKIVGTAPEGRAFVNRLSEQMKSDTRYEIGYWSRPDGIRPWEDARRPTSPPERGPPEKRRWSPGRSRPYAPRS